MYSHSFEKGALSFSIATGNSRLEAVGSQESLLGNISLANGQVGAREEAFQALSAGRPRWITSDKAGKSNGLVVLQDASTSLASAVLAVCELDEASESEPLGLLSTSPSVTFCIATSLTVVFAFFLACASQGVPCWRDRSCLATSHRCPECGPPSFEDFWNNQDQKQHKNVRVPGSGYWEFHSDLGNFQTLHL